MTDLASSFIKPLSDDDFDALGGLLAEHSPFDTEPGFRSTRELMEAA